jgi:hypothetical protein
MLAECSLLARKAMMIYIDPLDVFYLDQPALVSISSTMARPIASPMSM